MMIVGAYFGRDSLENGLRSLRELPTEFSPTHFGSSEQRPPTTNRVDVEKKYQEFLESNGRGHFLFAEHCRYDITANFLSDYATVFVDPLDGELGDDEARVLLGALERSGAAFWFGCQTDEYLHRNRYVTRMGDNTVESWVGRDLGKYLPGVYWITGLTDETAFRLGVPDFQKLVPSAKIDRGVSGSVVIEMAGPSSTWNNWEALVDGFCAAEPRIFSLERIRPQLQQAENYLALTGLQAKWR